MEATASANQMLLAENAINALPAHSCSHRPDVRLAIVTVLDQKTTIVTSLLGSVIVIRRLTDASVINVRLVTGTSQRASLATAMVTLRLAIQKLVNVFSAQISQQERTATLVLKAIMAIHCLEANTAADLVAVPTRLPLVTLTPVNVRSSLTAITTFTATVMLDMLERSAMFVMKITTEAPTCLVELAINAIAQIMLT